MNIKHLLKLADLNFSNRSYNICPNVFVKVQTTPLIEPVILHINLELLDKLEIDPKEVVKNSFLRFLNGDLIFEGLLFL